jgi:hypothetical protein
MAFEMGPVEPLEGRERVGHAVLPGRLERRLKLLEATPRDIGEQLLTVAEMPVGRRRANPRRRRRLREGEPGRPLGRNQFERAPA